MAFGNPVTSLPADAITAGILSAVFDLTGTIRTAASGARVELDSAGLRAYDPGGALTVDIDAATGGVAIVGDLTTGSTGQRVSVVGALLTIFSGVVGEVTGSVIDAASSTWLRLRSSTDAINTTAAQIILKSAPALGSIELIGSVLATSLETSADLFSNGAMTATGPIQGQYFVNIASGNLTTSASANVTQVLPVGRFTNTPNVSVTSRSNAFAPTRSVFAYAGNESTTSFTAFTTSAGAAVASSCGWIAVNG